ncbi:MAG: hypothetical protein IH892_03300 [Planctomycetes bacterium]|nr:hypothetical protein [Planctomycetota bacterium]
MILGQYAGSLSNRGERIELQDAQDNSSWRNCWGSPLRHRLMMSGKSSRLPTGQRFSDIRELRKLMVVRHKLYAVGNTALGPKNLIRFQPIANKGLARGEITIAEGSSEQGFVVVCAPSQGSMGPS